ncbi:unnamed protein product [Periconia digitata]|uniref:Uncharacterized protein n=1 Tax=Periconia digitata TaxID=1303443 RepID=A0A9W4XV79_9PLEO|nr:unnamed protein product [Periconia digitata]
MFVHYPGTLADDARSHRDMSYETERKREIERPVYQRRRYQPPIDQIRTKETACKERPLSTSLSHTPILPSRAAGKLPGRQSSMLNPLLQSCPHPLRVPPPPR